jgi:hypothetical protein
VPRVTGPSTWRRQISAIWVVLFAVSLVFPIAAGVAAGPGALPSWWGTADVLVAFLLAGVAILIDTAGRDRATSASRMASDRALRASIHTVLVVLIVFFLAGDRIKWAACLTGFAWRYWLLQYLLPSWFACRAERHDEMPTAPLR